MNIAEQASKVLAEIDEQLAICEKAPQFEMPTGYVGKYSVKGEHYKSGWHQGVASARTVCPKSLRMNKTAMNVFLSDKQWNEQTTSYELRHDSLVALSEIINQWNENK